MELTKNFTLEEMYHSNTAEAKGIDNTPNEEVIENLRALCEKVLQPIRDELDEPITVNSGYRCEKLNKAVGGVSNSQHKSGQASDITLGNKTDNERLFNLIVKMRKSGKIEFDQLLDESDYAWVHISYKKEGKNRNQVLHL